MAKDNKKLVQAITSQEENFAQWYTDICVKAELVEYSEREGFHHPAPLWSGDRGTLDPRTGIWDCPGFKATGQ